MTWITLLDFKTWVAGFANVGFSVPNRSAVNKCSGTVVLLGMTMRTSRYSGALAID